MDEDILDPSGLLVLPDAITSTSILSDDDIIDPSGLVTLPDKHEQPARPAAMAEIAATKRRPPRTETLIGFVAAPLTRGENTETRLKKATQILGIAGTSPGTAPFAPTDPSKSAEDSAAAWDVPPTDPVDAPPSEPPAPRGSGADDFVVVDERPVSTPPPAPSSDSDFSIDIRFSPPPETLPGKPSSPPPPPARPSSVPPPVFDVTRSSDLGEEGGGRRRGGRRWLALAAVVGVFALGGAAWALFGGGGEREESARSTAPALPPAEAAGLAVAANAPPQQVAPAPETAAPALTPTAEAAAAPDAAPTAAPAEEREAEAGGAGAVARSRVQERRRVVGNTIRQADRHFVGRRYGPAAAAYKKALNLGGGAPALYGLGRTALAQREPRRAVPFLEKAVRARPRSANYHLILGNAYAAAGNRAKATASWRRVLQLDPNNRTAKQALGIRGGASKGTKR